MELIDNATPEPPKRHSYGFHEMTVGDYKSFTFETDQEAFKCQVAAANIAKRRGWKFITQRDRLEDKVVIVNVWRVEKDALPTR